MKFLSDFFARDLLAENGVELGAQIGVGTYGKIYRGTLSGRQVAIKVISKSKCPPGLGLNIKF